MFTIGNTMRGDDGLGPLLSEQVYNKLVEITDKNTDNVYLLNTESTPENHTIEIRNLKPSHIIIIDAVEFEAKPGEMLLINKEQIDTFNISTHSMPISFIINYIEETIGSKIITIGIQPKQMELINTISEEVKESVEELTNIIVELV
ncbi:hydrogenase maturation peptidase HycI [Methanosphaera sp. ISO3-F5]|uniref:hydrogenase maturation peptidase HycI n=1 Tax=Methanosphaera sp. ISO3-F5 TaxID=1452353 RepID=UPI002B25DA3D|nr:hydrogenase maturation peptidase HycI [Methanosphaera sp. ISO3-F5]WQH65326.1 hydrogenase maturation peptidase HycI [Methanosphaera sp. ISO3-F5]